MPANNLGPWSIGIYAGTSPFSLTRPPNVVNPVITAASVVDVAAQFVADPFMVRHDGLWYMFFEVMNADSHKGEIALAVSADARLWDYHRVVLTEPFHLSYPHIIQWHGEYFMSPETLESNCARLYRCQRFPDRWCHAANLVAGRCADPTLFWQDDTWWMFVCMPPEGHATLRLFYSPDPIGPWREHPASPIVSNDARAARPAGRMIRWNERLLRFAQDCTPRYGTRVVAFEIELLTRSQYAEKPVGVGPVVAQGLELWNSARMHHVDLHLVASDSWIACVDGYGEGERKR